jgi:hypothetical protein
MPVRGKRPAVAKPAVRTTLTDEAEAPQLDADLLDRLFEAIRRGGNGGVTAALLEPNAGGDRDLLRRALEALRTDGRIEPQGRGRGTRYRLAENRLL